MEVENAQPQIQAESAKPSLDVYTKEVQKCSDIRLKIDNDWEKLREIGELFNEFYGIDFKKFMLVHRANYYDGEFDPETKMRYARLLSMVNNFSDTVKYMRAFDSDGVLDRFLARNGVTVVNEPVNLEVDWDKVTANISNLRRILNSPDPIVNSPTEPMVLAKGLLKAAADIQERICVNADSIKIDSAKKVEAADGILRQHFVGAVRISADEKLDKLIEKKLGKAKNSATSVMKSISIFK